MTGDGTARQTRKHRAATHAPISGFGLPSGGGLIRPASPSRRFRRVPPSVAAVRYGAPWAVDLVSLEEAATFSAGGSA
jgi:hypothetical protein